MVCENCQIHTKETYASGRFCSQKCSRSFSTKHKRKEINCKVSKTFEKKGITLDEIIKICENCKKEFSVKNKKKNQKTCSRSCSRKLTWTSEDRRKKASIKTCERNSQSKFSNTFGNTRCSFSFNGKDIRCDSKLEKRGLTGICKKFEVLNIERCTFFLEYLFEERIRRFNPDFLIETKDGKILMECKTRISKNKTNKKFRPLYFLTCEEKKKSMNEFCQRNNFTPIWYDGNKIK